MYKVGQKVELRTQTDLMAQYPDGIGFPFGFNDHMLPFLGKKVTISTIENSRGRKDGYEIRIKEDGCSYLWHSSVFRSSQDVTEKVHDKIRQSFLLTL